MKTILILVAVLVSGMAMARVTETSSLVFPGQCKSAARMHMTIEEKVDKHHYLVSQYLGPGLTKMGVLETRTTQFGGFSRKIDIGVELVKSGVIKDDDGFLQHVDYWKECGGK